MKSTLTKPVMAYTKPTMEMVDDTFTDIIAKRVLRMAVQANAPYSIVTGHDERNFRVRHAEGEFEVIVRRIGR